MKIKITEAAAAPFEVTLEQCGGEKCGGGIPRPPDTCCESIVLAVHDAPGVPVNDLSALVTAD
jgi:hypothetical protein